VLDQGRLLTVLCQAPVTDVKQFADGLIAELGPISVLDNRIGIVALPMEDPVRGATFYVGEVLVAEARVRAAGVEGYAACLGRDLEQALAVALIDAAASAGISTARIGEFVAAQAARQEQSDDTLLRQVQATRVEMETF
jgi:alpha-D-ribose 1-methylphosphonate 5-triphosphate synthase subunit PhnG